MSIENVKAGLAQSLNLLDEAEALLTEALAALEVVAEPEEPEVPEEPAEPEEPEPPVEEPVEWATGRYTLSFDGQAGALDFDAGVVVFPIFGAVSMQVSVDDDSAVLSFSLPQYGVGEVRLTHADGSLTGTATLAGQVVTVTGTREQAPSEPEEPVDPAEPEPEDPPIEEPPTEEPTTWATGKYDLSFEGQAGSLDFDTSEVVLPVFGLTSVTVTVEEDVAHIAFTLSRYGAGTIELTHADGGVSGTASVAGQRVNVTGQRAQEASGDPVPPIEPPPVGDGSPFFADDFDNGRLNSANGFRWTGSRYVDVVNGAMRFRYGPVEPNGQTHMWAEQRFSLPRRMTEVWVEFYIRYSKNFVHEGTRNDKFFRIWGGDYNNQNKVGLSTWGRNGADPIIQFDRSKPEWANGIGPSGGPSATWPISQMKDDWHRVRMHFRHATTAQRDALFQLWLDDELLINWVNADQKYTSQPYWDTGYILGYDNSRHSQPREVWIDNVRFFDSDPGWK